MKKKRSYYDKKTGLYIDITTGREYQPKEKCEICDAGWWATLTVHHYLQQQKCENDKNSKVVFPNTWTQEFINQNQRLFTLCKKCHTIVERGSDAQKKELQRITGCNPNDYVYQFEKKTPVKPRAIVVKKEK